MSELLIAEHLAQSRKTAEHEQINRFGTLEKHLAVLQTRFEAWVERAVQGEDLKELKREMESQMKDTLGSLQSYVVTANDQQAKDILGEVRSMFVAQKNEQVEDQKAFRRQMFFIVFSSALGVICTVLGALAITGLLGRA
jgi:hypothetical protein